MLFLAAAPTAQTPAPFEVHEATIAQIHGAMKAGRVTCRAIVEQYLRRIDMFDKNGPALNAVVVTNTAGTFAYGDDTRPYVKGELRVAKRP